MAVNRAEIVDRNFRRFIESWSKEAQKRDLREPIREGYRLTGAVALELFESQVLSRQIDFSARELKAKNEGFYTIGSAGHEGNVVLGRLLRTTDPCFLHYRSGALMMERSRGKEDPVSIAMLGVCASSEDPVAGGRHKIWGSEALWVPPQTSTIASHLPKAVGTAIGIGRARALKVPLPVPDDSIVCVSFGDASVNHSTAQGAFNTAQWVSFQHLPVPILFVCEDNGIGISVATPTGWIEAAFSRRPGLTYVACDGLDLVDSFEAAAKAIEICRNRRTPVFLHAKMVRLLGHAGSDVETEYLTRAEIEANEARDPLHRTVALLLESGVASPTQLLATYDAARERVGTAAAKAAKRPKLSTAEEVMAPLAPFHAEAVEGEARRADYSEQRQTAFGGEEQLPERQAKSRHLAMLLNWGLADMLAKYPQMMIFGEDVGKKGGVYHVTAGLSERFGIGRVFNTLLDEQTILGLGIGTAQLGYLPVPEIQYLAYYHNAEDQIRGEAASLQYFSNGKFRNPMVIRIASFAYQKGFGGHFHNDNSIAALRDIPGLILAAPARGDDAVEMLRTALALAKVDGRVVAFLEPIALYMTKDLYEEGDELWQCRFPPPGSAVALAEGRVYGDGKDLTIVTYGNGLYLSLRAARKLEKSYGLRCRILDLRWLAPLPEKEIRAQVAATGKLLVVDECRASGGVADAICALFAEAPGARPAIAKITARDCYVPLGPAAHALLPSEEEIERVALRLAGRSDTLDEVRLRS